MESLITDEKCHKTLQMLALRYIPLKSKELYQFYIFHKAHIVRNLYTI